MFNERKSTGKRTPHVASTRAYYDVHDEIANAGAGSVRGRCRTHCPNSTRSRSSVPCTERVWVRIRPSLLALQDEIRAAHDPCSHHSLRARAGCTPVCAAYDARNWSDACADGCTSTRIQWTIEIGIEIE